jgi:nucleoside-diphosphate-sugar epimerase
MEMVNQILVTGADGFVGRYVCRKLVESGFNPRAGIRDLGLWPGLCHSVPGLTEFSVMGDLGKVRNLQDSLAGVSVVVHLAARVHLMKDTAADPLREYRRVNVEGTKSVARAAVDAGVRRIIFVSTTKVHGEATLEKPFSEDMQCKPQDPYSVSKWEAEEALRAIAAESGIEVVIVRPPLVYGPGVRGNFLRLIRLVDRGIPIPLPNCKNKRSLLGVENLADFLVHCVDHQKAAGESFLVKDSEDVSTRELVTRLARVMARPIRYLPIPESIIRIAATMSMKRSTVGRLLDSLVIDSRKAQQKLRWVPPVTLDDGLAMTARWYREFAPTRQAASN